MELEELRKLIRNNLRIELSLIESNNSLKLRRGLQHFFDLKLSNSYLRSEYELLLKTAINVEEKCTGAGLKFLCRWAFSDKEKKYSSCPIDRETLANHLLKLGTSKNVLELFLAALDFGSNTSTISIKKSINYKSYIEITDGYVFKVKNLIKMPSSLYLKDCKIICIDGYIESVSEIHHFLSEASETNSSCILITRGMSDDVLHTIKVNLDRKTLMVYPCVAQFDLDNANVMVDIATVSGGDVLSSLKGDLITCLRASNYPTVDSCCISGGMLRIKNRATRQRARSHVNNLRMKVKDRPELEDLLSRRLKSLSSSCVDIYIPDDINYFSYSQQLDEAIRITSSIMQNSYDVESAVEFALKSYDATLAESFNSNHANLLA